MHPLTDPGILHLAKTHGVVRGVLFFHKVAKGQLGKGGGKGELA